MRLVVLFAVLMALWIGSLAYLVVARGDVLLREAGQAAGVIVNEVQRGYRAARP